MTPDAPIGIFDSGVGGLTVARAIADQLPGERLRYVGDTANNPYGSKSLTDIQHYTLTVCDALVRSGVKMLVIACNTASAACLPDARDRYPIPVVEVVLPAVRRAVSATRSNRVGVIGTLATINSQAYQDVFADVPNVNVTALACPRFVDFVERGVTSGRQILGLAQGYLERMQRANVDTVVLGCTHYPLLTGVLQIILGSQVTMVSSSEEAAKEVVRVLTELDMLADPPNGRFPRHEFSSTGPAEPFARLARRFLGPQLGTPSLGQNTPIPR